MTQQRVLVCGGREFCAKEQLRDTLDRLLEAGEITHMAQGGAAGADYLAKCWAAENWIPCKEYPADWRTYGKKAGPMRNRDMLRSFKPHLVLAFAGGPGTADMVRQAKLSGVPVMEIGSHGEPSSQPNRAASAD